MPRRLINFILLLITDFTAVTIALMFSHYERLWLDRHDAFNAYDGEWERFLFSGLLYGFLFVLFYFFGLYTRRYDFWEETRKTFQVVFFLFIFMAAYVFIMKTSLVYSRTMVVLLFLNMAWLFPLARVVIKRLLFKAGIWQIPALVVGEPLQVKRLQSILNSNWYLGYRPVESIDKQGIVFIATKEMPVQTLEVLIAKYKKQVSEVVVIPYLSNLSFANAEIVDLRIGQISMINIQNQLFRPKNIFLKQVAEIIWVLLLLPLVTLVYLVTALWIKIDSSGPVLFRQARLGKNDEVFECYKFRTMTQDSESVLHTYLEKHPEERMYYEQYHKYRNDPRITKAGYWLRKSSLDELPQILNILKGEMSLIGPRPYMVGERKKIGEKAETILHVKPGITGFWQIKGRNNLSFQARLDLDVWYIQNWSLWLDFIIFIKTFMVLLTRHGAR